MKRSAIAIIVAILALAATPASAAAAMVRHDHHREVFDFVQGICDDLGGIDARTVGSFVENTALRLSPSGFPMFSGRFHERVTFSDVASDRSVTFHNSGGFRDFAATDNGDGTFTRDTLVTVTETMVISHRTELVWQLHLVFRNTVDYNGTPANPDDDTFLSSTIVRSIDGPHSEVPNGCAVLAN